MTIYREGKIHYQEFSKGIPKGPLEVIGDAPRKTGTTIEFLADDTIFEVTTFDFATLAKRFREVAYLNSFISITLEDEIHKIKEVYHFEGGLKQFAEDMNKDTPVSDAVAFQDRVDDVEVDIAVMYNTTYTEKTLSFVNNIRTIDGGTHEAGFKAGLTRSIVKYVNNNAAAREKDTKITGDDVREGLIANYFCKNSRTSI